MNKFCNFTFFLIFLIFVSGVWAQEKNTKNVKEKDVEKEKKISVIKVADIYSQWSKLIDKVIIVEGVVDRWIKESSSQETGYYVLKDYFGRKLRVRCLEDLPPVGQRVRVTGILTPGSGVPQQNVLVYLQEQKRQILSPFSKEDISPTKLVNSNETHVKFSYTKGPAWKKIIKKQNPWIWAILVSFIFFLIGAIIYFLKPKKETLDLVTPVGLLEDLETIKLDPSKASAKIPEMDEETQKILPGYFEIAEGLGDHLQGRKIFITSSRTKIGREEKGKDKSRGWITFPEEYRTVSRLHAELIYNKDTYILINHSKVNPTRINGKVLKVKEEVHLKDGDHIQLGEVVLVYRSQ